MVEEWVSKFNLNHINLTEDCVGTYTFETKNGKSAINHILINEKLFEGYKGMHIDEDKALLRISDHNLLRAWFKVGPTSKPRWKKGKQKVITTIKKDEESLEQCRETLRRHIGKNTSFNKFMKKLNISVNQTLRKRKRIRVGKKGNKLIRAAEWVDQELMDNIRLRMKLNRNWRFSRKNNYPTIVQEEFKQKYEAQKKLTSAMAGRKKSEWEKKKIEETWKDGKIFWGMIRELLGKKKEEEEEAYVYTDEEERREVMEITYTKNRQDQSSSGMAK